MITDAIGTLTHSEALTTPETGDSVYQQAVTCRTGDVGPGALLVHRCAATATAHNTAIEAPLVHVASRFTNVPVKAEPADDTPLGLQ